MYNVCFSMVFSMQNDKTTSLQRAKNQAVSKNDNNKVRNVII